MADAVSWQAGTISSVSRKASSAASGPCSGPRRFRQGQWAAQLDRDAEQFKKIGRPVAGLEIDEAGVSGVGVFGNAAAAEPVKNVLGKQTQGALASMPDAGSASS